MTNCSPSQVLPGPQHELLLESIPDITGIGVVVGFVSMAYIALVLLILNYLLAYDPSTNPFISASNPDKGSHWVPNPIDVRLLTVIRRWIGLGPVWPLLAEAFDECIFNMCDMQLMSGFAIMISGFVLLPESSSQRPLSAYHWQIVVSLACFSCTTHLSGLAALRTYLARRRWLRGMRMVLMAFLLSMVVAGLTPTMYFDWESRETAAIPQSPAICYFGRENRRMLWDSRCEYYRTEAFTLEGIQEPVWACSRGDMNGFFMLSLLNHDEFLETFAAQSAIFMMVVLLLSFTTRCVKVMEPLARSFHIYILSPVNQIAAGCCTRLFTALRRSEPEPGISSPCGVSLSRSERIWLEFAAAPVLAFFLSIRFTVDLLDSVLSEMAWILFTTIWATLRLMGNRNTSSVPPKLKENENLWTFGQVMPVVLAVSPLLSMMWKFVSVLRRRGINRSNGQSNSNGSLCTMPRPSDGVFSSQSEANCLSSHRNDAPQPSPLSIDQLLAANRAVDLSHMTTSGSLLGSDKIYDATSRISGPCILASCGAILAVVILLFDNCNFSHDATKPMTTISEFWVNDVFMLGYLTLGYPVASTATVLVGMALDGFHTNSSGNTSPWTWCLLLLFAAFAHGAYFLICFTINPALNLRFHHNAPPASKAGASILTTLLFYACYTAGCVHKSWRKRGERGSGSHEMGDLPQ